MNDIFISIMNERIMKDFNELNERSHCLFFNTENIYFLIHKIFFSKNHSQEMFFKFYVKNYVIYYISLN